MANYPQELAQDAVCQSHTGSCQARPSGLNESNEDGEDSFKPIPYILLP